MSTDDERQGKRSFNEAEMGLTEELVEAIADQLGTRANRESAGVGALRERKDLEPSALAILMTVLGHARKGSACPDPRLAGSWECRSAAEAS